MKSALDLKKLLEDINIRKGLKFAGIGIVLCTSYKDLPISPLVETVNEDLYSINSYSSLVDFLIKASSMDNHYHDGFHILTRDFKIAHLSQYVSPPIVKNITLKNEYGSRYRTAVYCSYLTSVIATGVLSNNYPPTVFSKGNLIWNNLNL